LKNFDSQIRPEITEILEKVLAGGEIGKNEALQLISAEPKEVMFIFAIANNLRIRKKGVNTSFSRKVFLPLINICRNACKYCGFRREPTSSEAKILTIKEILKIARKGRRAACNEALFTLGEKPEEKYRAVRVELRKLGYSSTLEYLRDMCEKVVKETGLLPHSNPGVLTKKEMTRLKDVNASLGLMLENSSERLCDKGGPHEFSPGKDPKLRLATIEYAGQLKIPFTSGLLIGIGETLEERVDSLFAIKKIHEKYGNVQEIIIQSFKPKMKTSMQNCVEPSFFDVLRTLAVARLIFGGDMNIQAPPNLNREACQLFLLAGANDWGGISPVTVDYINPEAPWPKISELEKLTVEAGFVLKERLPVYPEYILNKPEFISDFIREIILLRIDSEGYVKNDKIW
jgi:7,8-didemethyl-8-hydroxy-5-deazariboflavin synthase CofG subunit